MHKVLYSTFVKVKHIYLNHGCNEMNKCYRILLKLSKNE